MTDKTQENSQDEMIDITTEEAYQKFCKFAQAEAARNKTMMFSPEGMKRFTDIVKSIKLLLDIDRQEYKITTKSFDFLPRKTTIRVETESFGAAPNDYHVFQDIVNKADSFDSEWLTTGNVRYYFGIENMFVEV
jgi:hypothetical protein